MLTRLTDRLRRHSALTDVLIVLFLIGLSLWLRCWHLTQPLLVYDEGNYVANAMPHYVKGADAVTGHPAVGPLIIRASVHMCWWFENAFLGGVQDSRKPLEWRWSSMFFGMAMIVLLYFMGKDMFGRPAGALAAFFLSIDFLHIVHSRIAMLDIYQSFFVLLFVGCVWKYIQAADGGTVWLAGGALSLGLGIATKWSTLFTAVGAMAGVFVLKDCACDDARPWFRNRTRWSIVFRPLLMVVPMMMGVYVLSLVPRFTALHFNVPRMVAELRCGAIDMVNYHYSKIHDSRPDCCPWYKWPTDLRPIWYVLQLRLYPKSSIFERILGDDATLPHDDETLRTAKFFEQRLRPNGQILPWLPPGKGWVCGIMAMGSPLVWWAFLLVLMRLIVTGAAALRAHGSAAASPAAALSREDRAVTLCVLVYVAQVGLWSINRGYIYYMVPTLAPMYLILAWTVWEWRTLRWGGYLIAVFLAASILTLALYWPLLVGYPIPMPMFNHLMWLPSFRL